MNRQMLCAFDRWLTTPPENLASDAEEDAYYRVNTTSDLVDHSDVLLHLEDDEGEDHWIWLVEASVPEILAWAHLHE